ncbi:MAG TPA: hypothetical protein VGD10_09790 [Allosphingosinicella sp.]|uniref:hypothetical protein n=1 Tax=Allosphingosinicella sp. TaxID=2823234 RepID=UPI002ED83188
MRGDSGTWKLLGIEPTDDSRAIKKAYAARLKAIDPDQDPQAFISLRKARDTALYWATIEDADIPAYDGMEAEHVGQPDFEPEAEQETRPTELAAASRRPNPWQMPTLADQMGKIEAILFDPAQTPIDHVRLKTQIEALLRHPDMATISRAEEIETWLAHLIIDAIPRSDALIAPATRRFDWMAKAQGWECPWYVEEVVARYHDCRYRDGEARDEHALAMRSLASEPPARSNALKDWAVARFLRHVRANHPTIERDFDRATIDWWDRHLAERRERFPWFKTLLLAATLFAVERLVGAGDMLPVLSAALSFVGAAGWFALKRRISQQQADDGWFELAPLTVPQGAALAILLLLPLAAVLAPRGSLALVTFALAAGGLALLVGRAPPSADEDPADRAWQARIAILAPILWLHASLWRNGLPLEALIPIAAAAWAAFAHTERVRTAILGGRQDNGIRAAIVIAGIILWYQIATSLGSETPSPPMPILLVLAITLVIVHQMIDPPDPWQKEWTSGSLIAVMAVAFGGPILAMLLVTTRTGRSVARTNGGS